MRAAAGGGLESSLDERSDDVGEYAARFAASARALLTLLLLTEEDKESNKLRAPFLAGADFGRRAGAAAPRLVNGGDDFAAGVTAADGEADDDAEDEEELNNA